MNFLCSVDFMGDIWYNGRKKEGEAMELGKKLRAARLEQGLSQRALCGEQITRNMLSRIEHGTARPSMQTLQYLAQRLGKPVSFFLEETAVTPNQMAMAKARAAFARGSFREAMLALEDYAAPDESLDWERGLLAFLCCLTQGERCAQEGREPVASKFLSQTYLYESPYLTPELKQRRDRLSYRLGRHRDLVTFPSLDEELLQRAEAALSSGQPARALALLGATEQRDGRYFALLGRAKYLQSDYETARDAFLQSEHLGTPCDAFLEECYRELGDYENAYRYARKRR